MWTAAERVIALFYEVESTTIFQHNPVMCNKVCEFFRVKQDQPINHPVTTVSVIRFDRSLGS